MWRSGPEAMLPDKTQGAAPEGSWFSGWTVLSDPLGKDSSTAPTTSDKQERCFALTSLSLTQASARTDYHAPTGSMSATNTDARFCLWQSEDKKKKHDAKEEPDGEEPEAEASSETIPHVITRVMNEYKVPTIKPTAPTADSSCQVSTTHAGVHDFHDC